MTCDHPLDGHTDHGPWCESARSRPLDLAAIAAYEAFRISTEGRLDLPAWTHIPPEAKADWRAVADAARMAVEVDAAATAHEFPTLVIQIEGGQITEAEWNKLGDRLKDAWREHAAVRTLEEQHQQVMQAYGRGRDDEAAGEPLAYEPFVAASGATETEIRVVPESAVAEAVAAERERCAQLAEQCGVQYLTGVNGLDQCSDECEHSRPSNRAGGGRHWHPFAAMLRDKPALTHGGASVDEDYHDEKRRDAAS